RIWWRLLQARETAPWSSRVVDSIDMGIPFGSDVDVSTSSDVLAGVGTFDLEHLIGCEVPDRDAARGLGLAVGGRVDAIAADAHGSRDLRDLVAVAKHKLLLARARRAYCSRKSS